MIEAGRDGGTTDRYADLVCKMEEKDEMLRQKNEDLKSSHETSRALEVKFEALRGDHASMQLALAQTNERCAELAAQKERSEREYESILTSLRCQLQDRMADFEDLQSRLEPPRDMEALRMRIQQELEVPFRKRQRELEFEISKYRKMYFDLRRENEVTEEKLELTIADREKQAKAADAATESTVRELEGQVSKLSKALEESRKRDTSYNLKSQLDALEIRSEQTNAEIESLRKLKASLVLTLEETKLQHAHDLAKRDSEIARLQSAASEHERKRIALEERSATARSNCERAEAQNRTLRRKIESDRSAHQSVKVTLETRLKEESERLETDRAPFQQRAETLAEELRRSELEHKSEVALLKERASRLAEECKKLSDELRSLKRRGTTTLQDLQSRLDEEKNEKDDLRRKLEIITRQNAERVERIQNEKRSTEELAERCRAQLARAHEKLATSVRDLEEARSEKGAVEEDLEELRSSMHETTTAYEALRLSQERLRNEASAAVNEKADAIEKLREVYKQFTTDKEAQHRDRCAALEEKLRAAKNVEMKLRDGMKTLVARTKEKLVASERRSRKMHKRCKRLQEHLSRAKTRAQSHSTSQQLKMERLWSRIRELEMFNGGEPAVIGSIDRKGRHFSGSTSLLEDATGAKALSLSSFDSRVGEKGEENDDDTLSAEGSPSGAFVRKEAKIEAA
eukprot:g363.t1